MLEHAYQKDHKLDVEGIIELNKKDIEFQERQNQVKLDEKHQDYLEMRAQAHKMQEKMEQAQKDNIQA